MKVIVMGLLLFVCGSAFAKCYEDVDKFKGNELYWCGAWGTGGEMLGGLLGVDPVPYLSKSEGSAKLFIRLILDQSNFLYIKADDELVFITDDGQKVALKASSDGARDVKNEPGRGVYTLEYANYPITLEQFKTLAGAKQVDFAVYTSKGRVERKLKNMQLKIYNEFLSKVVAVHGDGLQ